MHARKLDEVASEEVRSVRHRAVSATTRTADRVTAAFDDDDCDAASIIALLADALEQVASTTTDPASRELAEDALALFQGR